MAAHHLRSIVRPSAAPPPPPTDAREALVALVRETHAGILRVQQRQADIQAELAESAARALDLLERLAGSPTPGETP